MADWLRSDDVDDAIATAREISDKVLDSEDLDDPEDLLHPLAEAFRVIDRSGRLADQ